MASMIKRTCFFCLYEICNNKYRILNFKNQPKSVCMKCSPSDNKACKLKFKNCQIDCSICTKVVKGNKCIHCTMCDHLVHIKCNLLDTNDIAKAETYDFICLKCKEDIFPLMTDISTNSEIMHNNTDKKKYKKITSKTDLQCFTCPSILNSRERYKGKKIIYNSNIVELCKACSIKKINLPIKDIELLEFLECSICSSKVNNEGIFCETCHCWVHPHCANISPSKLKEPGKLNKAWKCAKCIGVTFFQTIEQIKKTKDLYKTHDDCTICKKVVKTDNAINCGLCRHWVHGKCLGLSNKHKFQTFIEHYKHEEWFCY